MISGVEESSSKRIDQRSIYRLIVGMLGLAFLGVLVLFGVLLSDTWREYKAFDERDANYRQRLSEIRAEKSGREAYLRKLLDDPEFRDSVIRERLGYSREDEIIFRFEK